MNRRAGVENLFKDDMTGRILLGRYRTVRKLAAGGMGVVYLARHEGTHGFVKPVVVKLMLPGMNSDQSFVQMFTREAKILSQLDDPGIVKVLDFEKEKNIHIMVLEYVNGFQLYEWLKYRKYKKISLPQNVIIQLTINILESLSHAHLARHTDGTIMEVIHRDISPSNIMLTVNGRVKLVDFGIARMNNLTGDFKTQTGAFKGKLSYSAPERFAEQPLTVQCDLYSVGVTLYEMITGENPFFTGDPASTIAKVLNYVPPSIETSNSGSSSQLDDIVQKAIHKNSRMRFQNAMDFADSLRSLLTKSEREIKDEIAFLTNADFNDEMAEYLNIEPLGARDAAWRNPSYMPAKISSEEITTVQPPNVLKNSVEKDLEKTVQDILRRKDPSQKIILTIADNDDEITGKSIDEKSGSQKNKIPLIVSVGIILIMAGIIISMSINNYTENDTTDSSKYMIVQSPVEQKGTKNDNPSVKTESSPAPEKVLIEETSDLASAPVAKEPKNKSNPVNSRSKGSLQNKSAMELKALTNAFKTNTGKVAACIKTHSVEASSISQLSIIFTVTGAGMVESVKLNPQSFESGNLGKCIKSVARATSFPSFGKKLTFAIPITVSK